MNSRPMTRIDEIVEGTYWIATWMPEVGITFNQFLIDDERPALIHTVMHELFEGVRSIYAAMIKRAV